MVEPRIKRNIEVLHQIFVRDWRWHYNSSFSRIRNKHLQLMKPVMETYHWSTLSHSYTQAKQSEGECDAALWIVSIAWSLTAKSQRNTLEQVWPLRTATQSESSSGWQGCWNPSTVSELLARLCIRCSNCGTTVWAAWVALRVCERWRFFIGVIVYPCECWRHVISVTTRLCDCWCWNVGSIMCGYVSVHQESVKSSMAATWKGRYPFRSTLRSMFMLLRPANVY